MMTNNRPGEKMRAFKKRCRERGLRITPQRIAIYDRLSASSDHPTATEMCGQIRREFPNISLGTVNSALLTFAAIGLARVVEASGDPKRFDPDMKNHHHFRCVKCGRIIDFHDGTYDALNVPAEISKKYVVFGKKVSLEGLCDDCQKRTKEVYHGKRTKKADHQFRQTGR
jgi:Fur family peroxide stress response transcriptional regulator